MCSIVIPSLYAFFGFINWVANINLTFRELALRHSLWWRTNVQHVCFWAFLWWLIGIINSIDKTESSHTLPPLSTDRAPQFLSKNLPLYTLHTVSNYKTMQNNGARRREVTAIKQTSHVGLTRDERYLTSQLIQFKFILSYCINIHFPLG